MNTGNRRIDDSKSIFSNEFEISTFFFSHWIKTNELLTGFMRSNGIESSPSSFFVGFFLGVNDETLKSFSTEFLRYLTFNGCWSSCWKSKKSIFIEQTLNEEVILQVQSTGRWIIDVRRSDFNPSVTFRFFLC